MIELQTASGVVSVPTGMHEISLSAYHDFLAVLRRSGLFSRMEDEEEEEQVSDTGLLPFIDSLIEALGFVCSGELTALPVGNLEDSVLSEPSLLGVFSHVIDLATNFKPVRRIVPEVGYFFDYKGEVFGISPERASAYVTGITYTTAEAIEVLEADRILAQKIAETTDPQGMFSFEMDLRRLAVLARKDGEELPVQKVERERWIDERARFLKEVSADVALEIRFFFIGILMRLVKEEIQTAFSRD